MVPLKIEYFIDLALEIVKYKKLSKHFSDDLGWSRGFVSNNNLDFMIKSKV